MESILASGRRVLLPAALVALFIALLIFLLNLGAATAQNDPNTPNAGDAPLGAPPLQTPFYLPIIGSAGPLPGDVIPNQYIVVLQPVDVRAANGEPRSAALFAADVATTYGGDILYTYESALEGFAAVLPETAIHSLTNDPNVAYVEPDRMVTVEADQSPATWGIDRIDQRTRPLSNSYSYAYAGVGVHAYVIDTGLHATHTEFTGRVGDGYTAVNDGRGTADCDGHGTHVSGTLGGTTYGVAKAVTIHPVRVLNCQGKGSNSSVIAGVNWVAEHHIAPAVANLSLGGGVSEAVDTALRSAIAAGVTIVVAAGNQSVDACTTSPAREPLALTVGATTSTDARASYSNYGTCVDLFAPGSGITSAWYTGNNAIALDDGTSMAAPHVSGAVALHLQANPNASPAEVAAALLAATTGGIVQNPGPGSPNRLLYTGSIGASPTPTKTPVANTPTNTPPPTTPAPTQAATPTHTPVPQGSGEVLANGGFEAGRTAWSESSSRGYILVCNGNACGVNQAGTHSGAWKAWLGGASNEASEIRQTVALPAGSTPVLTFWYWAGSNDWCGYDYAYVNLIVNNVAVQVQRYSLCRESNTAGWVKQSFSLAQYAGSTVALAVRVTTDDSYSSSFHVDDLSISTELSTAGTVEEPDGVLYLEAPMPEAAKPQQPAGDEIPER